MTIALASWSPASSPRSPRRWSAGGAVAPLLRRHRRRMLWPSAGVVWVGVGVAIVSLLLTTISPDLAWCCRRSDRLRVWVGLRWGLMAGTLYGIGTLLGGLTSEASGMWSVVANRFSRDPDRRRDRRGDHGAAGARHRPVPRRDLTGRAGLVGGRSHSAVCSWRGAAVLRSVGIVAPLRHPALRPRHRRGVPSSRSLPAVSAYLMYRFLGHRRRDGGRASGSPAVGGASVAWRLSYVYITQR